MEMSMEYFVPLSRLQLIQRFTTSIQVEQFAVKINIDLVNI